MRRQEYLSRQILIDKHYPPHTRAVFRAKTAVGIGFLPKDAGAASAMVTRPALGERRESRRSTWLGSRRPCQRAAWAMLQPR